MCIATVTPSTNDRLAELYSQSKGVDKTLKFGSSFASIASNIISYSNGSLAQHISQSLASLGKTFSTTRTGMKAFDIMQDFTTTNTDAAVSLMNRIQSVCFIGSDAVSAIFFLENQGFYSIGSKVKTLMSSAALGLGLIGVTTSLIGTTNQIAKISKDLNKILLVINDIDQNQVADQKLEALKIGKEIALEKIFRGQLSVVEKVADIAAIVFGFAAASVSSSVFVPVMATLGLISASMALVKMWRETADSDQLAKQFKEAIAIANEIAV